MKTVSCLRSLVLVVTILGVTLRTVYATPILPFAQLKAAECCRKHCHHERSAPRSDDCCRVLSHAGDRVAFFVRATGPELGQVSGPLPPTSVASLPWLALVSTPSGEFHWTGPPRFLRFRTLRL